jgi:hypothetical protein
VARFTFIAKRSLLPQRSLGETVHVRFDLEDWTPTRTVVKNTQRALGGGRETRRHRADVTISLLFAPVSGYQVLELHELLDSVEGGEQFYLDLTEDGSAPLLVERDDESYTQTAWLRRGHPSIDYYQVSIVVTLV